MRDSEVETLRNHILYDLDTIRIEQTSISDPDAAHKLLKLLKDISDNIETRSDECK